MGFAIDDIHLLKSCERAKVIKMKTKIFIAVQPVKVEMIQDNYTTL